jgi:hypothetical protein
MEGIPNKERFIIDFQITWHSNYGCSATQMYLSLKKYNHEQIKVSQPKKPVANVSYMFLCCAAQSVLLLPFKNTQHFE